MTDEQKSTSYILDIDLDETSIGRNTPDIEQEQDVAIFDLLESNFFALMPTESKPTPHAGPYTVMLAIEEERLIFHIGDENRDHIISHHLSLSPFRRIVKDYFLICESYFEAIKTAPPTRIEAIDMARRGLHNEGCEILKERLNGKINVDLDTARRLFTLICALHWKG